MPFLNCSGNMTEKKVERIRGPDGGEMRHRKLSSRHCIRDIAAVVAVYVRPTQSNISVWMGVTMRPHTSRGQLMVIG